MNSIQMSSDKVLLTVFVTVLIGFLTAIMSIVRLVNDKESKTTDYRQAWTDSLRKCFATLISNINTLATITTSRLSTSDGVGKLIDEDINNEDTKFLAQVNRMREYLDKKILDEDDHIREVRRAMHESYALVRLHFKPNDLSFSRVEQKFDLVLELFSQMQSLTDEKSVGERKVIREKIHSASAEITAFSRDILKTEWEAVKRGETAYQRTKFWSIVGGAVALAALSLFGLVTAWNFLRSDTLSQPVQLTNSSNSKTNQESIIPTRNDLISSNHTPTPINSQVVNLYEPNITCLAPAPRQATAPKTSATTTCSTK